MQIPLQITFRHMDPSPALEAKILQRAGELEKHHPNLTGCRVVVELEHHHHHKGNLFHIRVDLTLPGQELVAGHESPVHQAYEDPYVAVRDAFDALRRQLEDRARRQRHEVKHHDTPQHGRISDLVSPEAYGRIASADGRDIYFHRNSLIGVDFDHLQIGMEVRFAVERGEQGPQASSVQLIGKHHISG